MTDSRHVPLTRPHLDDAEMAEIREVLDSGMVVQGPKTAAFEQMVADVTGTEHAVAVTSATAGLHLSLLALDIGPGDEVLVPGFTFPATGNVVRMTGATPVLVDVRTDDYAIDVDDAVAKTTDRTRAIMPVDPFGLPYDAEPLLAHAEGRGLAVIEDAACALGATAAGRAAGALGTMGVFSFHGRKIITTGEGGMVTTDDAALADRLRCLRNHGIVRGDQGFRFIEPAGNHRMSDIAGAIGIAQMRKLEGMVAARRAFAERLSAHLAAVPGVTPQATPSGRTHTFQSYVVLLDDAIDRPALIAALRERGVESTIGTYALHLEPVFAELGYGPDDLPGARRLGDHTLTLPLYPTMTTDDVDYVAAMVSDAMAVVAA